MALSLGIILFPLFLLLTTSSLAQNNNGNITIWASLFAKKENSYWLSSSGDFAFGFCQAQNQYDLFLLCICYAKILAKTIVWYANRDQLAPKDSKVNLTADRGLVLTSPQGKELWKSETILGVVVHAFMNKERSFVLQDNNSNNLWETFKNPTDTMLPPQVMDMGETLSFFLSIRDKLFQREIPTTFAKWWESCPQHREFANSRREWALLQNRRHTIGFQRVRLRVCCWKKWWKVQFDKGNDVFCKGLLFTSDS